MDYTCASTGTEPVKKATLDREKLILLKHTTKKGLINSPTLTCLPRHFYTNLKMSSFNFRLVLTLHQHAA